MAESEAWVIIPKVKNNGTECVLDMRPLVLCKDCTWWGEERLCENSDSPCFQNGCTHGNWFCADGVRKDD